MLSRRRFMNDRIASENGDNLVLQNVKGSKMNALTLYGKSSQDGTPSPDNPVPIVSAGSVMTTGAQLIDTSLIPPYDKWDGEFGGVYLKDERTWFLKIPNNNSVAKVWNEDFTKALTWGELMPTLSVGDIITFGQNVDLNETINIAYNSASGSVVRQGDSITVTQNFLDSLAQFYGVDGAGTTCERVEIQINRGTIALPWEPYTGGQPAANPYEGEIGVTVQGGNLWKNPEPKTLGGVTLTIEDGWCILNGTCTSSANFLVDKNTLSTGTYTLSADILGDRPQDTDALVHVFDSVLEEQIVIRNNATTTTVTGSFESNSNTIQFRIRVQYGFTYNNLKIRPMLNVGSTALPYEPYKQPQTLTLSTPGGLPGIPVSSGGNYTDESGQQWICDEVDFKRGKYVQRVWKGTFDGSENWIAYNTSGFEGFLLSSVYDDISQPAALCNQLIANDYSGGPSFWFINTNLTIIRSPFYDSSLDDKGLANWKAHLAQNPLEVMTYLETPIETDLSDEEMASYKALHTYSPATTVSNDAEAWMKVGYKTRKSLEVTT